MLIALCAVLLAVLFVTGAAPQTTTTYRDEVLSDNPAAYWRLGEALGTNAADEVGLNHGTYSAQGLTLGTAGALASDPNTAVAFDGSRGGMSAGASTALDFVSGATIEVWAKRAKSGSQVLVAKPGHSQSKRENYALWVNSSNRVQAFFGNGSAFATVTGPVLDTAWHHLVATYDNATARLYVDGAQVATASSTVRMAANTQPVNVGRASNGQAYLGGTLDEIALYPRVLTATRVRAHFDKASADFTAPVVTLTQPPSGSATNDDTPTFSGVAGTAAGDSTTVRVAVYAGGAISGTPIQTPTATRSATGAYAVDAASLANGTYTARAEQADAAGNVGTSAPTTFTIDRTAPAISLTAPADGSTTNDSTPTVAGLAGTAAGDSTTVSVRVYSGSAATGTPVQTLAATRDGAGAFSVDTAELRDGTYTVQAEQSDAAGNVGRSAPRTFVYDDVAAPAVTLVEPADGSTISDSTPAFSGTAGTALEDSTTVTVRIHAGTGTSTAPVQTLTTTRGSGGAYSATAGELADGTYTARAEQADAAGNVGRSAPATFTLTVDRGGDTTPPVVTLTQPGDGSTTQDATPAFAGTAGTASGDATTVTVQLYTGTAASGTPIQTLTATAGAGGAYSVRSAPLAEGTYTAQASQFDAAGNRGVSSANTFSYDDVTPPAITLTSPANGSSSGTTSPTFSGTAGTLPGDSSAVTVKVFSGSTATGTPVQTLTATRAADGAYSVQSAALAAGTYTARAEQADSGGNVGLSSANTFTTNDPVIIGSGDIAGCGSSDGDAETAAVLAANPDALVYALGDLAYPNGQPSEYRDCYHPTWGAHKARTRPTPGGHDLETVSGGPPAGTGYRDYFQQQLEQFGPTATDLTKLYYSYDVGTWHVVMLNAGCYYETPGCDPTAMEQWFRDDLDAHPATCTVAMWHDPRFSSGNIHGDQGFIQPLWSIAYEKGVDVVLNGHEHDYERFAPMDANGALDTKYGVRQFVVGTGGYYLYGLGTRKATSEVWDNSGYGVLKLTLRAGAYDWKFLPVAGKSFTDSGSRACHEPRPKPTGGPQVRSSASASANQGVSTLSIPKPAGTQEGDLLLGVVSHQGGSTRDMTPPTGWTAVPNADIYEGGNARIHAWWKVAGASEPSSYGFTVTGGTSWSSAGGVMAITGANLMSPIETAGGLSTGSTTTTKLTAPALTTTKPNTLLVYGGAVNQPATFTPPQFYSEQWDLSTAATYNVATETAVRTFEETGSTGTATATLNVAARGVAIHVAVSPAF